MWANRQGESSNGLANFYVLGSPGIFLFMILWTIRHTKPYNPNDVCYGRLDFDVSPTFESEASGAIEDFLKAGAKPTRLFSSPLLRAYRLAEKVSQATGLPVEKADAIQEINFGSWEGQKLTAVPRNEMYAWMKDLRGSALRWSRARRCL